MCLKKTVSAKQRSDLTSSICALATKELFAQCAANAHEMDGGGAAIFLLGSMAEHSCRREDPGGGWGACGSTGRLAFCVLHTFLVFWGIFFYRIDILDKAHPYRDVNRSIST